MSMYSLAFKRNRTHDKFISHTGTNYTVINATILTNELSNYYIV